MGCNTKSGLIFWPVCFTLWILLKLVTCAPKSCNLSGRNFRMEKWIERPGRRHSTKSSSISTHQSDRSNMSSNAHRVGEELYLGFTKGEKTWDATNSWMLLNTKVRTSFFGWTKKPWECVVCTSHHHPIMQRRSKRRLLWGACGL